MDKTEALMRNALESGVEYMNALNGYVVSYLTNKLSKDDFVNACIELSDGPRRRAWAKKINEALATEAAASLTRQTERVAALEKALKDATAHLAAATSAYQRFCRKGVTGDALYTTRLKDFEAATSRARSALNEPQAPTK